MKITRAATMADMVGRGRAMTLTSAQKAAAEATDRYVQASGAPGCGKSTVLAARAAHLIKQGIEPCRILVLCFTRSGASSIRQKVQEATGQEPQCDTFDRYALGLLTEAGAMEGLSVATDLEHETAIRGLYEGGARLRKGEACNISSLRKAITDYQSGKRDVGGLEAQTIATLSMRLSEVGRKPLWELVPEALALFDEDFEPYQHVLVDEAGDVTPNEEKVAVYSMAGNGSVFVARNVGQEIMAFRGAAEHPFESLEPKQYAMVESFRFGEAIAEAVNVVGRRLGVPDVVGLGPEGSVHVVKDEELYGHVDRDTDCALCEPFAFGDTLVLAPTNVACEALVRRLRGCAWQTIHCKRDAAMDPTGPHDPFELHRELGEVGCCTVHMSRSREYPRVVATGLEGGTPAKDRLAYVALSRAMQSLVVVEP